MDIHRVTDAVIVFCSIRFSEQASINKSIGKCSKELVVQLDTRKKGNEIICKSFSEDRARRFKVENISSLSEKTALVASVSTHDTTPFIAMMFGA